MRIKVRIYNPYDLDIIALTEAKGFSVANAMKQVLKYYAAGKRCVVEVPNLTEHLSQEKYVKGFYVELDDVADAQAVEFIRSIPDGLRNSFMKSILRASLEVAPISLYIGDGGAEYVSRMIANPRYGKCPVQREILDPVSLADGEVGVTVSETMPDISQLPHGHKATPSKKKASTESLRDLTQNAYTHATRQKEEKLQKRTMIMNKQSNNNDNEMDSLLDSIM